jgi:RNA polymerase sigma-70 factor (ECF subfamily)
MALPFWLVAMTGDGGGDVPRRPTTPRRAPSTPDNGTLLARLRAGDHTAFRTVYDTHYPTLWDYAMRYVRVAQTAEDVVHDVLQDLWERRTTAPPHAIERAYLLSAVRHRALQLLRHDGIVARTHASETFALPPAETSSAASETELDLTVARRLAEFPPRTRQLFVLRWRYGMSYPEIGQLLGISTEAAKKLGQRVAVALSALLDDLR